MKPAVGVLTLLLFLSLTLAASEPRKFPRHEVRVRQAPVYVDTDFPWAMFRQDPSHTGFTQAQAPSSSSPLWNVTTGGSVVSSPIVSQGVVYVGSSDTRVYAINESSGGVLWTWKTGAAVTASPAESDGVLYVASQDRVLYALTASSGLLRWSSAQIAPLVSSPTVVNGRLFIGTQFSASAGVARVLGLNATSGATLWSYDWTASINSSPAVDQGRVFVGTVNGWVVALDETSGGFLWSYQVGTSQVSSPAVEGGTVYVGTSSNRILALDSATGVLRWSQGFGGASNPIPSSPAVGGGRVFFGTGRSQIVALNSTTGSVLWTALTGGAVSSSPALTQDAVLVGSSDGRLYAVSVVNGASKWAFATAGAVVSSPALADGLAFVGSQDGKLYSIGPAPPVLRISVTASPLVIRGGLSTVVSIYVSANSIPQSGVSLSFASSVPSNTTGPVYQGSGLYVAVYTAPVVGSGTLVVFTVVGSKPGFVAGTGQGSVVLEPLSFFTVYLTASSRTISPQGNATLMLQLLNSSLPVVGALVSAQSSVGGEFSSVVDLGNGNYTVMFSPPARDFSEPTSVTVTVAASKPGFSPIMAGAQLVVFGLKGQPPGGLPQFPVWPVVLVGALVGVSAFGAYWFKGRDRPEKIRPLERSLEFREALLRAVDTSFGMVGQNVWRAIMETLEYRYGVRKEEIPDKLDLLDAGLVATLGTGASMVEMLILKRLYAELDMDMPSMIEQDFVTFVNNTYAAFLRPSKRKKKSF